MEKLIYQILSLEGRGRLPDYAQPLALLHLDFFSWLRPCHIPWFARDIFYSKSEEIISESTSTKKKVFLQKLIYTIVY